jgi:hypothetical protein
LGRSTAAARPAIPQRKRRKIPEADFMVVQQMSQKSRPKTTLAV